MEIIYKMDKTELKAQKVTSKEEQLITRKRTAKIFLDDIVKQVKDGNIPAPFAALQLKQLTKSFTSALDQIQEQALDDLVGTEHYIWGDYKITRRQGTRTVDYSDIEEIQTMKAHTKEIEKKYKAALEGVENGVTITLEGHKFTDNNGEILDLPKYKYNKDSIVLTKV